MNTIKYRRLISLSHVLKPGQEELVSIQLFAKRPGKKAFALFCRLLYDRNLVTGVGGNVSIRCGNNFLVTPSGWSLRDITEASVLSVKADGSGGKKAVPSKEFAMHVGIYSVRPDVNVVCHIHGEFIIAASAMVRPGPDTLPPITPGFVYFAHPFPMIPFFVPGSAELAEAVKKEFADKRIRALLLQNHGLITVGKNMAEALNIAEEVNENAAVYVLTRGKATTIPQRYISRVKG